MYFIIYYLMSSPTWRTLESKIKVENNWLLKVNVVKLIKKGYLILLLTGCPSNPGRPGTPGSPMSPCKYWCCHVVQLFVLYYHFGTKMQIGLSWTFLDKDLQMLMQNAVFSYIRSIAAWITWWSGWTLQAWDTLPQNISKSLKAYTKI